MLAILLPQALQAGILVGVAAKRCGVDDEDRFAGELRQRQRVTLN